MSYDGTTIDNLIQMVWGKTFGCSHQNCTFPVSPKPGESRPPAAELTGCYIVCLTCGKELAYDWQRMRIA